MTVRSILKTKGSDVVTISPNASLADAVTILNAKRIGAIVVSSGEGRIDGILSERDIVRAIAPGGLDVLHGPVSDTMTAAVVTCHHDHTVADVMEMMTARKFRHMPVEDHGRLCGIISIGDIVKARLAEMERESSAMRQYIAG